MSHQRFSLIIVFLSFFSFNSFSQTDQQLVDRYDEMYAAEKYELASKAAETLCQRYPTSALWHFNAGALAARLQRPERAISHLRKSANCGFTGIRSFEQNSDLDPIRERKDFIAILESVRTNARERMEEFQQEAKLHKPPTYTPQPSAQNPPLIIALHGTGMKGQDMYDALLETAKSQGAVLVCPDALRPVQSGGFSWTYRDESEWFVEYLIEQAKTDFDIDPEKILLIGFSQGANIALILGQTHPDWFLAVIPICGHYEPQVAESQSMPAPFYLITGARDPWKITYSKARQDFKDAGAPVQIRVLTGRGHELPRGKFGTREYTKAVQWALKLETDSSP